MITVNKLFICSIAKSRSKTSFNIYGGDYAGTDSDAIRPVTSEQIKWADTIYCMERRHRSKLRRKFKGISGKIKVLNIPDEYEFMEPRLVSMLVLKLGDNNE